MRGKAEPVSLADLVDKLFKEKSGEELKAAIVELIRERESIYYEVGYDRGVSEERFDSEVSFRNY